MKLQQLRPEFVEHVPDSLEEGVLYISERYRLCSHKCCCGCGEEVVLPLSPAEWCLTREGELVSLWPSVGNWDYACRSHYVIRRNAVFESPPLTEQQIAGVQRRDAVALSRMVALNNAEKRATAAGGDARSHRRGARGADCTWSDCCLRAVLWRILTGRGEP